MFKKPQWCWQLKHATQSLLNKQCTECTVLVSIKGSAMQSWWRQHICPCSNKSTSGHVQVNIRPSAAGFLSVWAHELHTFYRDVLLLDGFLWTHIRASLDRKLTRFWDTYASVFSFHVNVKRNGSHAHLCTWTHVWYLRNSSLHGSALRSPFRNFSANQRLKHWSYSRLSSVQPSPTLFIFTTLRENAAHGFNAISLFIPRSPLTLGSRVARDDDLTQADA